MPKSQLEILTEQMFYVLMALKDSEKNGVEIVEFVKMITENRILIGPGTLYAMLSKFENEDIIIETKVEGRKRWYKITEMGIRLLQKEILRLKTMIFDYEKVGE